MTALPVVRVWEGDHSWSPCVMKTDPEGLSPERPVMHEPIDIHVFCGFISGGWSIRSRYQPSVTVKIRSERSRDLSNLSSPLIVRLM